MKLVSTDLSTAASSDMVLTTPAFSLAQPPAQTIGPTPPPLRSLSANSSVTPVSMGLSEGSTVRSSDGSGLWLREVRMVSTIESDPGGGLDRTAGLPLDGIDSVWPSSTTTAVVAIPATKPQSIGISQKLLRPTVTSSLQLLMQHHQYSKTHVHDQTVSVGVHEQAQMTSVAPSIQRICTPPMPLDWSWVQVKRRGPVTPSVSGTDADLDGTASRCSNSDSDSIELVSAFGDALSPVLIHANGSGFGSYVVPSPQSSLHNQLYHQNISAPFGQPFNKQQPLPNAQSKPSSPQHTQHKSKDAQALHQSPIMNPAFLEAFRSMPDFEPLPAPCVSSTSNSQSFKIASLDDVDQTIPMPLRLGVGDIIRMTTPPPMLVHGPLFSTDSYTTKRDFNYGSLLVHPAVARTTSGSRAAEIMLHTNDAALSGYVVMERPSSRASLHSMQSASGDITDSPILVPFASREISIESTCNADTPSTLDSLRLPTRIQASATSKTLSESSETSQPIKEHSVGSYDQKFDELTQLLPRIHTKGFDRPSRDHSFDLFWPISQILDGDIAGDGDSWSWLVFKLVSAFVAAGLGGYLAFKCGMIVQRIVLDRIARLAH
ncbi:hypothetical protein BDEG_23463 [Batrachochytrium dendrobatidis JEL423]|nr:hypothetical protein BDEG_23463 [Batrachochytrium dendrobatidis JEL423]